ncbi:MAG: GGDEF domain-containing protein [Sphingomonas sp. 28-62-20]|uniref:GGDEF domain-containing protein n=1 Tax=Sphingomonas sp. 28-62-20 TaxID=1970433 RepID=UPI000BCE7471|nr:MAG: GGDEF domain-containing protein [Sphingomonas sp. 28-62-20]
MNGSALRANKTEDNDGVSNDHALFLTVGEFLARNRLSSDPVNYEFAYRIHSNPAGALAQAVAVMTDGGIRLTRKDIESLGGRVAEGAPVTGGAPDAKALAVDGLVAQTQMQVEGFQDLMRAMHSETRDFGRDLAASADALQTDGPMAIADVRRLTTAMVERINAAESRLAASTQESEELRRKLEEARDNARRDPLTALPNRRAFEEAYLEKSAAGATLCVAVCDIDRFKLVNDGFGHAVGDRVLKAIADVLADQCEGDLVARYGGEEFVVLFAGATRDEAEQKLETARQVVARKRYRLRESDAPLGEVTFSAGLTVAHPDEAVGDVFVRADRLLYAAKAAGRNCLKTG